MEGNLTKTVRSNMYILRKRNHVNIDLITDAMGFSCRKGYYDLEAGRTDLKLKHIKLLMDFYNVPLEFLAKE